MTSWPSVTICSGFLTWAFLKARLTRKISFKSSSTSNTVNLVLSIFSFLRSTTVNLLLQGKKASGRFLQPGKGKLEKCGPAEGFWSAAAIPEACGGDAASD